MSVDASHTADDGVSKEEGGGRTGGGESGGGAFKDSSQVKGDPARRKHGGQSEIEYHGPGDAESGGENANAVAAPD